MIKIFTDGSTRGGKNQRGAENKGGFGVVVMNEEETRVLYASGYQCVNTTNNRMELRAILEALLIADELYPQETIKIISDSAYCVNMLSQDGWIYNWARNHWRTAAKKPVENLDLVQPIYNLISQSFYHCYFAKIDGHSEHVGNELADAIATDNMKKYREYLEEYEIQSSGLPQLIIDYPL